MPVVITLDEQEMDLAAFVGSYRYGAARDKGYQRSFNIQSEHNDYLAAAAELAVSKARGVFWNALSESFQGMPDLADGSEVKQTSNPNNNLLIPAKCENRKAWYYLVLGEPPDLTIYGRAWGVTAMQDKYWDESMPAPCWKVMKEDPAMKLFRLRDVTNERALECAEEV